MANRRAQPIEKQCEGCGGTFAVLPSRAYRVCCSVACIATLKAKRAERVTRPCLTCGKAFTLLVSQTKKMGTGQYCSRKCIPQPERVPRTCEHCGVGFTVKLSRLLIGKYKGVYCSLPCQRDSQKTPLGPSKNRPGTSTWRRQVVERDGRTCQQCGAKPKTVYAHHIKEWSKYPELRFELSNGITLCYDCHRVYHQAA